MKNSTSIQSTPQADFVAAIERAGLSPPFCAGARKNDPLSRHRENQ